MEVNKDEALRSLDIARNHLDSGNIALAIKFAKKSINLYPTPEAQALLRRAEKNTTQNGKESDSRGTTPPTSPSSSSSSREHKKGRTREYTVEQAEIVKRVRACKVHDFYGILGISKEASDLEVKKSYRKVTYIYFIFLCWKTNFYSL